MLTSVGAWNEHMINFLNELCETFPECPELFAAKAAVEVLMEENETEVMERFVEQVDPHADALSAMDEKVFFTSDIDFLKRLNIVQFWTPDLEEETKQAIWQYLQTLLVMGKTIMSVPPQLLRALEGYAAQITNQMTNGEMQDGQLDMQTLGMGALKHMQQQDQGMFNSLFGGPGANEAMQQMLQSNIPGGQAPFGASLTAATNMTARAQSEAKKAPSAPSGSNSGVAAPIGFEALQQMLSSSAATSSAAGPFHMSGFTEVFAQEQQRAAIQRNGPIPPPAGYRDGLPIYPPPNRSQVTNSTPRGQGSLNQSQTGVNRK